MWDETMPRPVEFAEAFSDAALLLGLSRPAGQCFAAIWRAAQAPCADDLTEGLGLSRSNVSTALKELRDWGLISRVRAPGDRKEYFAADPDAWVILGTMLSAFQRRSLSPAVDRVFAAEAESGGDARAAALHAALSLLSGRLAALAALPAAELARAMQGFSAKPGDGKKKKKKRKDQS
jgi:DNA-binding transcriptional regulator GbsR (MarR family)